MPRYFRRRRRRRSRRRPRRRRRRSRFRRKRRRTGAVSIGRQVVPKLLYVTLPYVTDLYYNIGTTAPTRVGRVMSCNSAFDPDQTGTGHQPLGFDQWKELFSSYTVVRSHISAVYTATTEESLVGALSQCRIGITKVPASEMAYLTVMQTSEICEQPATVHKVIASNTTNGGTPYKLKMSYNSNRFWKVKTLTDNELESNFSSNPFRQAQYYVWASNKTSSLNTTTISVFIQIKMWFTLALRRPALLVHS